MFTVYKKDGSWRVREIDSLFFMTQEEALNGLVQIASNNKIMEFDVTVEEEEHCFPSPYEQILGFQICNRCFLHPCEC